MDRHNNIKNRYIRILPVILLLTVIAAVPRLYHLGDLGFYMDEETTAFAARSLAEGKTPQMPSGMPYMRSLPYTWLAAWSARTFGVDKEFSYRLPSALLGTLTIPLLFLLLRPYTGTPVALLAALLMALSEWHIITSRQARMYVPFLFFYISAVFSIIKWTRTDSNLFLALSLCLFYAAVAFHTIGVLAALVPLLALSIKGFSKIPTWKSMAFSAGGGISAYIISEKLIIAVYGDWIAGQGIGLGSVKRYELLRLIIPDDSVLIVLGCLGIPLGLWLADTIKQTDHDNGAAFRKLLNYLIGGFAGWFTATGLIYGAASSLLTMLLLSGNGLIMFARRAKTPMTALFVLGAVALAMRIFNGNAVEGIKSALSYPYPYWLALAKISQSVIFLFACTLLYLSTWRTQNDRSSITLLCILGLYPILAIGFLMKWAPARYFIEAYPFILAGCAYAIWLVLLTASRRLGKTDNLLAGTGTILIALSGLLGGHGLLPAFKAGTATYGDNMNEASFIFPTYPDHKTTGEFVRDRLKPDHIVVAEDALEQRWYATRVDYWLRDYDAEAHFLYKGQDEKLHDIYVNSIAATQNVLSSLLADPSRWVWVITSAETYHYRSYYLNEEQRDWLGSIEDTYAPVYVGHDDISKVYCLHCDQN